MPYIICDDGGATFDRYTIIDLQSGAIYGASSNPFAPNGFGQYCGDVKPQKVAEYVNGNYWGRKVDADCIPAAVVQYAEMVCVNDVLTF